VSISLPLNILVSLIVAFKFFIDNDVINYRFGAPCFPRELVYILMPEESVSDL
jgi:hypothetical protein